MKIRRTIPSATSYSPSNMNNNQSKSILNNQNKAQISLPNFLNDLQPNAVSKRSSSPHKPIFDKNRKSVPSPTKQFHTQKQNNRNLGSVGYRKSVTFEQAHTYMNSISNQSQLVKVEAKSSASPTRRSRFSIDPKYKRQSIFEKSNKNNVKLLNSKNNQAVLEDKKSNTEKIDENIRINKDKAIKQQIQKKKQQNFLNQNLIQVQLNVKELSERLKTKQSSHSQQKKLIQKINVLQNIVRSINDKIQSKNYQINHNFTNTNQITNNITQFTNSSPKRIQKVYNNQQKQAKIQHHFQKYKHHNLYSSNQQCENKVLQLQLQQLQRCQKIAKQNQMLYSKLVTNLQNRQNKLITQHQNSLYHHDLSYQYSNSNSKSKQKNKKKYNYLNYQSSSTKKQNKVTAFQDFHHYQRNHRYSIQQNEQNTELTSPFLLQQNKGTIKITR